MTKIKICGITNQDDAWAAVKYGADALGFNFFPPSPRFLTPGAARRIVEKIPEKILKVGVFVDETVENIILTADRAKLDAVQLHGNETADFVAVLRKHSDLKVIKAFRVNTEFRPRHVLKYKSQAVLLDAYSPKEHGGTGTTFDWKIAIEVAALCPNMYLAGGLNEQNIGEALSRVRPFAVDACSGLEIKKGFKDQKKLKNFIRRVREFKGKGDE